MSLKVKDIQEIMQRYAPSGLKEDYDNVGLMVGETETEITSILMAMDCTLEVIDEAIEKKCNFILTHHPLLFLKPKTITDETLRGRKIIRLIKNDINLYAAHTNLDSVKGGLNEIAVELLGLKECNIEVMEPSKIRGYEENSGVGRLITLKNVITLKELCKRVKDAYEVPALRYSGSLEKEISKIAIINGSGEDFFGLSKVMGADCIITGDTKYHYVSDITEEEISIIDGEHFNTEWPAFKVFAKILKENISKLGYNNEIHISEACKSPYNVF